MTVNKKESLIMFHRDCIISASEKLFFEKGLEKTTMDDIAKEAQYSKATIYVYFKNKNEIVNAITYKGMQYLNESIKNSVYSELSFTAKYYEICNYLVTFFIENPFGFEAVIGEINVDLQSEDTPKVFHDIFNVGKEIDNLMDKFFNDGINIGIIKNDIAIPQAVLFFWGSLSGIIKIANKKQEYIRKCMNIEKNELMQCCFKMLLDSILIVEV